MIYWFLQRICDLDPYVSLKLKNYLETIATDSL